MTQPPNELPTLITPDEMADLKALLPTPLFQQLKYLMADLLGKVERGEYEDIAKFRQLFTFNPGQ